MKSMKEMMENKRGIASRVPLILMVVGMVGVLIALGVGALVVDAFNTSVQAANDTTQTTARGAESVFSDTQTMLRNFTNQLGTAGTIAGVLILVVLLAAAGIGLFNMGRNRGVF